MRRILLSLLLAGVAATPAIAAGPQQDRDSAREERQQAREDRQSAREEHQSARQERSERSSNNERPQVSRPDHSPQFNVQQPVNVRQQQVDVRQQAVERRQERANARVDRGNSNSGNAGNYVAPGARVVTRGDEARERQAQMRDQRAAARELRQSSRPTPAVINRRPPVVSNTPAPGTQPPLRTDTRHSGDHHRWDTNWRHNDRYDWHNYRHRHRSLFHLGFYYDPYGWGYQPFSIGWRLWPSYYSSRYWINDPWMYRLPYAPVGYVWVRYWNDALLVDTWSGTVVDVIPGFFW